MNLALKRDGNELVWQPGVGPAIVLAYLGFGVAIWIAVQSTVKGLLGLSATDFTSVIHLPPAEPMSGGNFAGAVFALSAFMLIVGIKPYGMLIKKLGFRTRISIVGHSLLFRNNGDYPFFLNQPLRVVADIRARAWPLKSGVMGIPTTRETMSSEVRVVFEQEGRRFRLVANAPGKVQSLGVPLVSERQVESFIEEDIPTIALPESELREVLQAVFPTVCAVLPKRD